MKRVVSGLLLGVVIRGFSLKLAERLQVIYDQLLPGQPVWDFCCDHGYLGMTALRSGAFPRVCFVDQVPHIIEKLQDKILPKLTGSELRADFFAMAGGDLPEPVCGTAVIAGVGAHTIFQILQSLDQNQRLRCERLILAPQKQEELLLEWLQTSRYQLLSQQVVRENGRERVIFIYAPKEKSK